MIVNKTLKRRAYEFEKRMQSYGVALRCTFPVEHFCYPVLPTVPPLAELDTTLQQRVVAEGLCPAVERGERLLLPLMV